MTTNPGTYNPAPTEAQLRTLPAGAAGASGLAPRPPDPATAPDSAGALYYFLESARPATSQSRPAPNPAPPGLEPGLGYSPPALATAGDPRSLPGRSAPPGAQHASAPPKTPGVELGAQPVAAAIPPASAFDTPSERQARGVPAAAAGAARQSPQPPATPESTVASGPGGALYFVDEARAFASSWRAGG